MQSMSWAWNSFLCSCGSKRPLEGLLGDSSQMNSSFPKRTASQQCLGGSSASWTFLYSATAAADELDGFGGPSSPTSMASEHLEGCSDMQQTISPRLGLWTRVLSVGFLNPSILHQLLHWTNLYGLISTFSKEQLLEGQNCQSNGFCGALSLPF